MSRREGTRNKWYYDPNVTIDTIEGLGQPTTLHVVHITSGLRRDEETYEGYVVAGGRFYDVICEPTDQHFRIKE